jgi:plastocyanin
LTSATCSDGSNPASIALDPGETVTCTFTNTKRGSIKIIKDAVPNHAQDFSFTTTGTGLSAFNLDDDADNILSNNIIFGNLVPGAYSVTEGTVAGWDLSALTCSDTSTVDKTNRIATITLDPGENVICTFTNTKRGSIKIIKDAVPNHTQDFGFTTTGSGLSSFSLDDDADPTLPNNTTFTNLVPGTFTVTEGATAGWSLSGLTCNDTGVVGSASTSSRMATIKLDPGENVTCTFTNSKLPANTGAKTIGFWQNKNGQAIITGQAKTGVCPSGTWLRQFKPFQDLSATATCAQVATYVTNVIKAASSSGSSMNPMLKAQMLATALDVYFSGSGTAAPPLIGILGGNKIGAAVSIGGVTIDLTNVCKMIDSSGGTATCSANSLRSVSSAFGGATSLTVSQMLAYAASQSNVGGSMWYGNVKATQELAKDAFDAINNQVALAP